MSIKFHCAKCNHGIKVAETSAGKVIKCPECAAKMRVPADGNAAASKKRSATSAKEKAAPDSDAFLENLDLGQMSDAEIKLCQKCATVIPEGETTCPGCGFDPEQLTAAGRQRKKMAAKGIDTATFYEKFLRESFGFAGKHLGQVFKTGMLLSFYATLAGFCAYFLVWVATGPPFAFWTLLTTVSAMIPLGWLLIQHLEIITLTLQKKDEIKKIRFDFALAGMSGMKLLAWALIYGLPFWIIMGGFGLLLRMSGVPFGMEIGFGFAGLALLVFTPQAMSHMTMPVETAAWFFPKVAKTLKVSFLPGLVWAGLFLGINLPVIAALIGVSYLGGANFQKFVAVRLVEGEIHTAKVMLGVAEDSAVESYKQELIAKYTDKAAEEPPEKSWSWIVWPVLGGYLCCFMISFSSLVVARANGLFTLHLKKGLDLVSQAKEVVWQTRQDSGEKIRTKKTTTTAPPAKRLLAFVIDSLLLVVVMGLLGFIFGQVGIIIIETVGIKIADEKTAYYLQLGLLIGGNLLAIGMGCAYFAIQESEVDQATVGQKAMGIFVCDENCRPISTGIAAGRYLSMFFLSSVLTLYIGNLICLFRPDKKTLHDLITGTQVRMDKPQEKPKVES